MPDKSDELKIEEKGGGGGGESPEETERVTPDVEADFLGLLKDYGVAEKAAKIITKHIAETGTPSVFEDPRQLLEKMAKFPRHVPPVTRKNILEHWTAARDIPVPEGFEEEAGLPAEELKERKGKGTAPEKYSVDTDTGAIKVASTTDKALTWDEAEKLSKEIKKDIDTRGGSGKEPAFVLGEKGTWTLNPQAKIGFGEFAVFQMYQDSLKRGEPIDPVELLTKQEEQSVRLKEAMGVKAGREEGGLLETIKVLGELGVIKKGEEGGKGSELELLAKLSDLGLLKHGEREGSETMRALEMEVKELKESLQRQELNVVKDAVLALAGQMTEIRKEMSSQGKLEGRYALMNQAIQTADSQLSGLRGDVKTLVTTMAEKGGPGLSVRSPGDKARKAKGLKEAIALEQEAHQLEDELVFNVKAS